MFHSYLGTLLYYSFFFFFSFDYHTFLSIPSLLYISMHPCIVVSPRILVSLYRLDSSFFSFCPPPLVLCIQRSPRVLYSSPSLFFDIPATGPTIFVPLVSVRPTWSSLHLPSSFLSQNLSFSLCVYIPHSSSVLHPILVIFISHKFNPTSLRLAPYTFHCSIKRPTRICTRVYTMNSVVVQKANRIRVGHDTS